MPLALFSDMLSPTQMAKYLRDNYGYAVTTMTIIKWDNEILRKVRVKHGKKLSRRAFSLSDVTMFNAIAVMRNLGFSIAQIKKVFSLNLYDEAAWTECLAFIKTVKKRIEIQKRSLVLYDDFLEALKDRSK